MTSPAACRQPQIETMLSDWLSVVLRWKRLAFCTDPPIAWLSRLYICSNYPSQRSVKDTEGGESQGVPGTLSLLQNITLSTQPIAGFDWNSDKQGLAVATAFDQTLRVLIVTKLNTLWRIYWNFLNQRVVRFLSVECDLRINDSVKISCDAVL